MGCFSFTGKVLKDGDLDGWESITDCDCMEDNPPQNVAVLVPKEFQKIVGATHFIEKFVGDQYGVYGGCDVYGLLAIMNDDESKQKFINGATFDDLRNKGIDLGCSDEDMINLKYPLKIVVFDHWGEQKIPDYEEMHGCSFRDPEQGWDFQEYSNYEYDNKFTFPAVEENFKKKEIKFDEIFLACNNTLVITSLNDKETLYNFDGSEVDKLFVEVDSINFNFNDQIEIENLGEKKLYEKNTNDAYEEIKVQRTR